MYSNPDTQLGAQNKNFGADLQTDLTKGLVTSAPQASEFVTWVIGGRGWSIA